MNHQQKDYYTYPMHPEIKQDYPGKCPKCGGMDLVKKSELDGDKARHDHASMMSGPEAAGDFLRRFFSCWRGLLILCCFHLPVAAGS